MYEVEYSPESIKDTLNIKDRISLHYDDNVAEEIVKKIFNSTKSLGQYPFLGADLGKKLEVATEYRYLYTEKDYIFYYVGKETIKIVRIINERQDFMRMLFNPDDNYK